MVAGLQRRHHTVQALAAKAGADAGRLSRGAGHAAQDGGADVMLGTDHLQSYDAEGQTQEPGLVWSSANGADKANAVVIDDEWRPSQKLGPVLNHRKGGHSLRWLLR
jgi:hypothetical protein